MPLRAPDRHPTLDKIITRLEIQTGKRFIQSEKFNIANMGENLGKNDPSLLTIAFGQNSVTLVLKFQVFDEFPRHVTVRPGRIETGHDLKRRQASWKLYFIRQVKRASLRDFAGQRRQKTAQCSQ